MRAKSRLSGPKKRRTDRASTAEQVQLCEEPPSYDFKSDHRLTLFAILAWGHDYTPILKREAEENGAVDAVLGNASSYRQRSLQHGKQGAAFWQSALRISRDHERLKREKNIHYISFSQVCILH